MSRQNAVHQYDGILFSHKNEIVIHATAWMKLKLKMKEARHKRSTIVWFYLYEIPRIGKTIEAESRIAITQD